jgi:hypothetical protein
MARNGNRKVHIPALVHHKASGRARVRLNGRDTYCGPWGSPESEETYRRLIAEWLHGRTVETPTANSKMSLSIAELILAYYRHAESYYVKNGEPTSELRMVRDAVRVLKDLYGSLHAESFGPLKLKTVREEMIRKGWCRRQINKQIDRIKRCFRWGVENELVSQAVFGALRAITGLRKGRTEARESKPVMPVA